MTQPKPLTAEERAKAIRLWVDGPPPAEMIVRREEVLTLIDPDSGGRWPRTATGIYALARACYESGYDEAAFASRDTVKALEAMHMAAMRVAQTYHDRVDELRTELNNLRNAHRQEIPR